MSAAAQVASSECDSARPVRLLIVDDNEIDRDVYRRFLLRDRSHEYLVLEAASGEEAIELYREGGVDCVLLDYHLPDRDGLDVLMAMGSGRDLSELPVVVCTGQGNERIAVEAMKRGSQDYVVKGELTAEALSRAIHNCMEKVELRRALRREREALDLSRRDQLRLKDRLLSHVSHELRTPLAAIHQFLSLVIDGLAGSLTSEQREYLDIASRNAQQLAKMISDLMDASRAESGKLRIETRRVELPLLLEDCLGGFWAEARSRGIELRSEVPARLPGVMADETRIRQIVANLIDNALKFTPEGGFVRVRAETRADDPSHVEIAVSDTGRGISPDGCQHIFERLHQEGDDPDSRRGLGIGLFICSELVQQQGGRIWVDSELGRGSHFRFTLPTFDLARAVRPALLHGDRLRERYGVIRVDLAPRAPGGRVPESAARSVHHLLSSTSYPETDVLLPRGLRNGPIESFFLVAGTGEDGLAALLGRIRQQIAQDPGRKWPRVHVEVRGRLFPTSEEERNQPVERALDTVAERICQLIRQDDAFEESER